MVLFKNLDGGFYFEISKENLEKIKEAYDNNTNETGGILIGKYSEDRTTALVNIVTIEENTDKTPECHFERPAVDLKQYNDMGLRYIGDWHTHPGNCPEPSEMDKDQMLEFSKSNSLNCPEVILLIMGKNHTVSVSVHTINGLYHLMSDSVWI